MIPQQHINAANFILAMRKAKANLEPLPKWCRPATLADGYEVQEVLHQRLKFQGILRCGWKIGCTNKVLQELLNIPHPCAGGIMVNNTVFSGTILPWSAYVRPGIECEVAFEIGEDLPASKASWTREAILERVVAIMPAIEVVDDRYKDHAEVGTPTLIADDFFHAGVVLGTRTENFRDIDLARIAVTTNINGEAMGTGKGAAVMGHPAEPLAWLANMLAKRGVGLKRQDIVITGSMVNVQWLTAPCEVSIDNSALGSVAVSFA
jgi:2-keto-4-pentenoate hydratase